MRVVLAVLISLYLSNSGVAAGTSRELSCAAFAPDETLATAVVSAGKVGLEMRRQPSSAATVEMKLDSEPRGCRIFFSRNGEYAAIAVYLDSASGPQLRIGVLSRATGGWASNIDVTPKDTLQSKIRFEGFLQNTSTLVVTGTGAHKAGENTPITTVLYSPDGKVENEFDRSIPRSNSSWDADAVDARRNHLWFIGSPDFCPIRSVTLSGSIEYGPAVSTTAIEGLDCYWNVIAFPREDIVFGASTGNDSWMWKVDLHSGRGEKVKLPQARPGPFLRWISYSMPHQADVSPDGDVVVLARSATAWDLVDRPHDRGSELDIIQLEPFGLAKVIPLEKLKPGCSAGSVAVEHAAGKTSIVQRLCGKWNRIEVPMSPAAKR
jgi:hypothetical protein